MKPTKLERSDISAIACLAFGWPAALTALLLWVFSATAQGQDIPGTPVLDTIVPSSPLDTYPTHDAIYGKGGLRTVDSIEEMQSIPAARRADGMLVYVEDQQTYFQLLSDLETWQIFGGGIVGEQTGLLSVRTTELMLLLSTNFVSNGSIVQTFGRQTPGDGGGLQYIFDATDADSTTNLGTCFAFAGGRFKAINWQPLGSILPFGARENATSPDSTVPIQAAIDAAYDTRGNHGFRIGGQVYIPAGTWVISDTLRMKPKVVLKGVGGTRSAFDISGPSASVKYLAEGNSEIYLKAGANCTMIDVDKTVDDLLVWQADEVQEDGSVTNTVMYPCSIRGIVLWANGGNQTRYDCHAFDFRHVAHIEVADVGIVGPSGYMMFLQDVNQIRIDHITTIGIYGRTKGILQYGCGDNILEGSYIGNSDGPTIWYTGGSQWKNQIVNIQGYNAQTSKRLVTAMDTGTGTVTLAANHTLESGMPVEVMIDDLSSDGSSWPSEMDIRRPYWAIKVDANKVAFATTISNALAGNAITFGSSYTGTNCYVWEGCASGLYASWGTRDNIVDSSRFDQHEEHGMEFSDAGTWTVTGGTIDECGWKTQEQKTNGLVKASGVHIVGTPIGPMTFLGLNLSKGTGIRMAHGVWVGPNVATAKGKEIFIRANNNYGHYDTTYQIESGNTFVTVEEVADDGTVQYGYSTKGSVMTLYGGTGGQSHLKLKRDGAATVGFLNSPTGVLFKNEDDGTSFGKLLSESGSPGAVALRLGDTAASTPRKVKFYGEGTTSGTNNPAQSIEMHVGTGVGTNAANGFAIYVPTLTSTNNYDLQAEILALLIDGASHGTNNETPIQINLRELDGTLQPQTNRYRIKFGADGTGPGGTGRALWIDDKY